MAEDVKLSSSVKVSSQISNIDLERDLVATVIPPGGESQVLIYDPATPSKVIISGSTSQAGVNIEPHYIEEMTESVERRGDYWMVDLNFVLNCLRLWVELK